MTSLIGYTSFYQTQMSRFFLISLWFFITVFSAGGAIGLILYLKSNPEAPLIAKSEQPMADLPVASQISTGDVKGISTDAELADARAEIVGRFLERHKSPMQPYDEYGTKLVEIADRYSLDYRLLPAIAMQESNLCKVIPAESYNCLGFGIHSKGTLRFDSYEAAFDRAAKTLKEKYVDIGLTTPQAIMTKYTPHSNGSWAESVNQWIAEMEYDSRELGRELKTDADLTEYIEKSPPEATASP